LHENAPSLSPLVSNLEVRWFAGLRGADVILLGTETRGENDYGLAAGVKARSR